jgi:CheY-like chemotaxis protein
MHWVTENIGIRQDVRQLFCLEPASYNEMQVETDILLLSSTTIDLPTTQKPEREASQESMPATILLIDDNAVQAATRQTILRRAGYIVIVALSPTRALEQFRQHEFPIPIDLILTDHVMPSMNGSEFITILREFEPNVPVLVISGMAEAEDAYQGLNVHFRMKPLLPDNLLASVKELVSSRP